MQALSPPVWSETSGLSTHQLLFVHIPKCAGSSFRNGECSPIGPAARRAVTNRPPPGAIDSRHELHTAESLTTPPPPGIRQHAGMRCIRRRASPPAPDTLPHAGLLLEFTRTRRKPHDIGCVFYRDVHFREQESNGGADGVAPNGSRTTYTGGVRPSRQKLLRAGPDCILADGMIDRSLPVLTGHIGFGASLLSRIAGPFTAIVFLREPVSRLVSLFNMYPSGTWGGARNASAGVSETAVAEFARVYHSFLAGRNALTCFVSGDRPCDSRGATTVGSLGSTSLRRAQHNLLHRFAAFGLTERLPESFALIAHTLGWRAFHDSPNFNAALHLAPGSAHRRLSLDDLCTVPGLLHDLGRAERLDRSLHAFAASVFEQRVQQLPRDLLSRALRRPPGFEGSTASSADDVALPSALLVHPPSACSMLPQTPAELVAAASADARDASDGLDPRDAKDSGEAPPATFVRDRVLVSPDDPASGAVYLPRRVRPLPAPTRLFNDDGTFDTVW